MLSKCCSAETYLDTTVWIKQSGKRVPFRNSWYCLECKKLCLFLKEEELHYERTKN